MHIEGITRVTHLSTSGANIYVELNNTTKRRLVIKSGEVEIMVDGNPRLTISLREKIIIPKGHSDELLLPLRFRSSSTMTLGTIIRRLVTGNYPNITVSYRMRAGTRLFRKTFSEENIAISEFFDTFAISKSTVSELDEFLK